ncbi:hypothetical protein FSP39_005914 [Pinctada imbricata]|uniref:Sulfotransferase domain-containing protein n=1 Tax=Pinctada imbricata TaxID=66713 RepID=A0AA88YJV4_PINIB|nr:hypothetical protein FSP39_005914 [Pinctada imbricata]
MADLKEDRFIEKIGDLEFDFTTINGIGIPTFPSSLAPGGILQRVKDIQNLECRHDDVILATYPKSGTHWASEILNMLVRGNADYAKEAKINGMLEFLPDLAIIDRLDSPRILNTHLPYQWLPKKHLETGGKIINVTRNPKDVSVSAYYFVLEGLYLGAKTKDMTWSQFFDHYLMGKTCLYGTWFDYTKEMEKAKSENENIYTIQYEALKKNPIQEIKGLATFLPVKTSDELVTEIAAQCEIGNLKKATKEVKKLPPEIMKIIEERMKVDPDFRPPNIYRKGIVGDWKNHFTVSQNERFDALYKEEMKDSSVEVIYE